MIHFRGQSFRQPKSWADVKKCIGQFFGVKDVPRLITETLDDEGYMAGAFHPKDGRRGTRECLARACELAEEHPELGLTPKPLGIDRVGRVPADLLSEGNGARLRLFADHVVSVAQRRKDVVHLRKSLFGGRLMKVHQVRKFLASLAVQMLTPETFKANRVSLLAHTSSEVANDSTEAEKTGISSRIKIEWEGRVGYVDLPEHWFAHHRTVPAIAEDGHLIHYPARKRSVLDVIGELAESLVKAHPWKLQDAVIFLLTDKAPQFRPVSVRSSVNWTWHYHYGLITLEIEPWVAARDVQAIYQHVQRESFSRPLKACSAEKIEVYRFVQRQMGTTKKRPSMARLMQAWNSSHPGRNYSNYRLFGKDYERVERWVEDGILYPKYKMLGGAGKPTVPKPTDDELGLVGRRASPSERAPRRARSKQAGPGRPVKVIH